MTELIDFRVPGTRQRLRVRMAARWASRALGLLATRELRDPCGLWIRPCRSIHTCFMRYPIDVVFLRRDGVVTKVVPGLKPWRMASCRQAHTTLELRAGLATTLDLQPGMALDLLA